jgi:hypothetical protein
MHNAQAYVWTGPFGKEKKALERVLPQMRWELSSATNYDHVQTGSTLSTRIFFNLFLFLDKALTPFLPTFL